MKKHALLFVWAFLFLFPPTSFSEDRFPEFDSELSNLTNYIQRLGQLDLESEIGLRHRVQRMESLTPEEKFAVYDTYMKDATNSYARLRRRLGVILSPDYRREGEWRVTSLRNYLATVGAYADNMRYILRVLTTEERQQKFRQFHLYRLAQKAIKESEDAIAKERAKYRGGTEGSWDPVIARHQLLIARWKNVAAPVLEAHDRMFIDAFTLLHGGTLISDQVISPSYAWLYKNAPRKPEETVRFLEHRWERMERHQPKNGGARRRRSTH